MSRKELLRSANPNAHGRVRLYSFTDTDYETEAEYQTVYVVALPGEHSDDGAEFDEDRAAAEAYFEAEVARLQNTPNWEAQAAYDEAHGTDNGYAPWQAYDY